MALSLACAAPAAAQGAVIQVTATGELRIDGQPGESSRVEVYFRTADEAGFNGVSDRIIVGDDAGSVAAGDLCVVISNGDVSCDARPVGSIAAAMGDGNDAVRINAGKTDFLPASYPVSLKGGEDNDVLRAGLGDAVISGEGGSDIAAGYTGDDRLSGGRGGDGLVGFTGNDLLSGGPGSDAIFGQKGRDAMRGDEGNDVLLARDGFRDRVIDCGAGGAQQAIIDRRDPQPRRCKTVSEPKDPKNKKK
ncbi:MAG: hypothetical protein H0V85_07590 [Thermoleophilaceae bacterium]|nr:hypothetical protein [Thermoleophilaceae bacterium]